MRVYIHIYVCIKIWRARKERRRQCTAKENVRPLAARPLRNARRRRNSESFSARARVVYIRSPPRTAGNLSPARERRSVGEKKTVRVVRADWGEKSNANSSRTRFSAVKVATKFAVRVSQQHYDIFIVINIFCSSSRDLCRFSHPPLRPALLTDVVRESLLSYYL